MKTSSIPQSSMLIKSIIRSFGSVKHPKGDIGKQNTLGANFHFPRHKELFNEGYYNGETNSEHDDDGSNTFNSPFMERQEKENARNANDAQTEK